MATASPHLSTSIGAIPAPSRGPSDRSMLRLGAVAGGAGVIAELVRRLREARRTST